MRIKIKVFRYNPESGEGARYDEFELNVDKGKTILDCLMEIKENLDSTLTFEGSCNNGICGGCAVRINGKSRLACHSQSLNFVKEGIILIEPLSNFPVIKDLVVDKTVFWKNLSKVMPYLVHKEISEEDKGDLITEKELEEFKRSEKCILCSICYSECTAVKFESTFLGPAATTKIFRFMKDPRDAKSTERLELLNKGNVWACSHQFHCTELCPKNIDPGERIYDLKKELIDHKFTKSRGAKNTGFFFEFLKKYGKLNFSKWGIKVGNSITKEMLFNLKLNGKGRHIPFMMKKIKNHAELIKIFKRLGEK
jgi:succinate dehydrogenase / fumarate reductase iron-sulfur subunit